MPKLHFPKDFIFGSAVASYQVEGNSQNTRKSDWDDFINLKPSQIIRPGEVGPNWWKDLQILKQDLNLISQLGVSMQRLSLEWARIEPTRGVFDQKVIDKYKKILEILAENNLEPMITLNHFVLPSWIGKGSSWENKETVKYFLDYVERITKEFKNVRYWIIFNEPSVVTFLGYLAGIFPPGKQSLIATHRARKNIIAAQRNSYDIIKNIIPNSQAGNAYSIFWLRRKDNNSKIQKHLARFLNTIVNTNFISATIDKTDFIGVNYYTGYYVDFVPFSFGKSMRNEATYVPYNLPFAKTIKPKTYMTDMGWPIVPDFFLSTLRHIYQIYKKPIFITENGIADRDDIYRSFYIYTHLLSVYKALQDGVDIRGYLHWATVDNLEWVEGYAKRFGLIDVNPRTGKRYLKESAKTYEKIIKENSIDTEEMLSKYIPTEERAFAEYITDKILNSGKEHCPRCDYRHVADK